MLYTRPHTPVDDRASRRAALIASMALLFYSGLTTFALIGWFKGNAAPWNWKSALTVACAVLGVAASGLVWRAPSRERAMIGVMIMLVSLLRIGLPRDWTWVSFALVAVTFVLLMPVVHAAIVLRREE